MGVLRGEGLLGGGLEQRLLPEFLAGGHGSESWVFQQCWISFRLALNSAGAVFCEGME